MRILVSLSDKSGIVNFINKLIIRYPDLEIISTSGTSKYLKENNFNVVDIDEFTSFPEILNGRVKTLHPKIFGAILSKSDSSTHEEEIKKHDIKKIDMVICNLYQFEKVINSNNFKHDDAIENIDIGGSSILRAAAKNYSDVTVVIDPSDYDFVANCIIENKIDSFIRKKLASKVFNFLSNYDNKISKYLSNNDEFQLPQGLIPENLRYGENPHQMGILLKNNLNYGVANSIKVSGKKMSYNNYLDADVAFSASHYFEKNCVAIVKHSNVCGLSVKDNQTEAYKAALGGDPVSSYGGIIGFNTELKEDTAKEIVKNFFEIIIAPDFDKKSLLILKSKKNLRIVKAKFKNSEDLFFRSISGGLLAQSQNINENYDLDIVTERKPDSIQLADLKFAWNLCLFIKSNSIILVKNQTLLGMGAGQPNRVMSVKIAGEVAGKKSNGSILASDAFFPFTDSVIKADDLGVKCIIQPGGSINDKDVINEANKRGIVMIFTNQRRFTH
ncbi:MAG: bifunctional phosphoribosylaminoimidazolecarboxamide formyltransferase/IMP cyclohydrolase [Dehalococcoidia bacterium]|tara:strand:+ start:1551 stop:3050 length:1500 start_codon:yes stop_codon:yes gene_type:complete